MGYARRLTVPPGVPGLYHCTTRCVRRASLCGTDPVTGRSFAHRRDWLEARLLQLARLFAVDLYGYAVMDNHLHVVLYVDPTVPQTWSAEIVAERWLELFPGTKRCRKTKAQRVHDLVADEARITELRERLGSLSWFMKCLKEPIARTANREDECTGHFWEGRFWSQMVLDDSGMLSCMAYVDLNPKRAGKVRSVEDSEHTSLARRLRTRRPSDPMRPIAGSVGSSLLSLREGEYFEIVAWTAGAERSRERTRSPPALGALRHARGSWLLQVSATERGFGRVLGREAALAKHARERGLRWIRGIGTARQVARLDRLQATAPGGRSSGSR